MRECITNDARIAEPLVGQSLIMSAMRKEWHTGSKNGMELRCSDPTIVVRAEVRMIVSCVRDVELVIAPTQMRIQHQSWLGTFHTGIFLYTNQPFQTVDLSTTAEVVQVDLAYGTTRSRLHT